MIVRRRILSAMDESEFFLPGALVAFSARGLARPLDGFWAPGRRASDTLLILVHGMGSNYYRSAFKKATARETLGRGRDILLFNNRGAGRDVATERFRDCMRDLDAAVGWAIARGYRRLVLVGHSTGCQKITYWMARRRHPRVRGLVLAAVGDDLAIVRRELGRAYPRWLRRARALVRRGRGDTLLPSCCLGFAAHRFLSVADPTQVEASLFDFSGELRAFRSLTLPLLALFPAREQYACIPVAEMAAILAARTRSPDFASIIIPHADHGFHGHEDKAAQAVLDWVEAVAARSRPRKGVGG